jgi:HD superfamily phosphohydrolase
LLWPDGELHRILEAQEEGLAERIALMLRGQYFLTYLPRLLSGDIDVDRCDFLLRDAHQTGVGHGGFSLDWLISTSTIGTTDDDQLVLGFDRWKAPRVIEQFIVARRALYDTVYRHRVARSAEGMVGLLLRRLRDLAASEKAWPLESGPQFFDCYRRAVKAEALDLGQVLQLDDYSLGVTIKAIADQTDGDPTATTLAQRIIGRDLFKQVPVTEESLAEFLGEFGREQLEALLDRHFGKGLGKYFLVVDPFPFRTLSNDPHSAAYLVEPADRGLGSATPARDVPELRHLFAATPSSTRLYAPRETVSDLKELIEPDA